MKLLLLLKMVMMRADKMMMMVMMQPMMMLINAECSAMLTCIHPFHSSVCCLLSSTATLHCFMEVKAATKVNPRNMKPSTSLL